jgi:hypothetical protein
MCTCLTLTLTLAFVLNVRDNSREVTLLVSVHVYFTIADESFYLLFLTY